jgi:hypothetical protein
VFTNWFNEKPEGTFRFSRPTGNNSRRTQSSATDIENKTLSSAINFSYDYRFASAVEQNGGRHGLKLATSGGLEKKSLLL